ncbi:MAG: hypothetical protein ABIY51_11610 [Ferruginibacter sp.]
MILAFTFAVFITETLTVIPMMMDLNAKEKTAPKSDKKENYPVEKQKSCCSKMMHSNKCTNKKERSKNTPGKNCNDSTGCTTCPVCYNFTFQPSYQIQAATSFLYKRSYAYQDAMFTSHYLTDVWKPPNVI